MYVLCSILQVGRSPGTGSGSPVILICMMDFELYYFYCRFSGLPVEDISTSEVGLDSCIYITPH